ncbi:ABC-2 type transport system ATP-binding protein [Tistlia consotensis]|uniref:ABC-2 type transport system ATP-binding protein n=1 Tax=Tistlia consotensis USBA 355 TaxID=560819 RepID=A0A1Y6CGB4_9PROT|nr:ABC transporter ATP-binding protein [Tistlia consotensis]SMF60318.1 ABC-2 type transport system ATP-binding protein [Tistlia consotensis USBA 355]SNR93566.1 ABC-2 type transport system ATP-binding protein [Tistlia consotensis]
MSGRAAENGQPVIQVTGLTKRFGDKTVVDGFDMTVPKGAIYGFLGPNGSGKTTTIRMMCGLLTPDAGDGHCLGYDILTESRRIKERVGYMTQRFSLYEDLSIRENLDFMARMYRLDRRRQRVGQALEELGLADRAGQLAGTLSGGWKQRLALAACLLHEPALLLLDEPTAGVDPKARRDFWDEIRGLSDRGVTVLVSTHYMDEAVQCDFIAYIAYGTKLIDAPAAAIPRQVGLATWKVEGPGLAELARTLAGAPGVEQIARFGAELHVSGTDAAALGATAQARAAAGPQRWTRQESGLEEVFIHLMAQSRDNFARDNAAPDGGAAGRRA